MPSWMGKAVDMEVSGVAALIKNANKVFAIFDTTEDRPRAAGGTFRAVKVGERWLLELSRQTPGQALADLPRIEAELPEQSIPPRRMRRLAVAHDGHRGARSAYPSSR